MKDPKKKAYLYGALAGFGAISLSVVFFFLLYKLSEIRGAVDTLMEILAPIVYGGVIAYLLRPICNWYLEKLEKIIPKLSLKVADALAVLLAMVTGVLVVYALIAILAPQLYDSIISIWESLPDKADQLIAILEVQFAENKEIVQFFDQSGETIYTAVDNWVKTTIMPNLSSIVSGVGMSVWKVLVFLKNLLIGVIVAVYLLLNRKQFLRQCTMLLRSTLKPKWAKLVEDELVYIDMLFGGFITGKLLDSAIIGVLCYIGCSAFQFPNALLVSAIVGVTNIIPFFGPFIGAIPSVILIFLEEPVKGLWFVLFIFVLQQLDGNVIGPKILGDKTGLSSFWVLFSMVLFGGLWGLAGMIIGVPLMAVIYDLVRKYAYRGLKRNHVGEAEQELPSEET